MKLALVTHAEHPKLRGTLPDFWPEFMAHDPVVQGFWPQLYDQYPDFQLWVVDRENGGRRAVAYACSVPVAWNGTPSPRGVDWALTDGVEGTPTLYINGTAYSGRIDLGSLQRATGLSGRRSAGVRGPR